MSSDARLHNDGVCGWLWYGNHDGPCVEGAPDHSNPSTLSDKIIELEECLGHSLCWLVDEPLTMIEAIAANRSPDSVRIRGWVAHD
jgi:hypothetical protein